MDQPNSPKPQDPEPGTLVHPQNEKDADELTEDDLESISGGTGTSLSLKCATGKHIAKAEITVR